MIAYTASSIRALRWDRGVAGPLGANASGMGAGGGLRGAVAGAVGDEFAFGGLYWSLSPVCFRDDADVLTERFRSCDAVRVTASPIPTTERLRAGSISSGRRWPSNVGRPDAK